MGQPPRKNVLRLHAVLLAVRQRRSEGLPESSGGDQPARFASAVLGAREMGSQAAGDEDRQQPALAQNQSWTPATAAPPAASSATSSMLWSTHFSCAWPASKSEQCSHHAPRDEFPHAKREDYTSRERAPSASADGRARRWTHAPSDINNNANVAGSGTAADSAATAPLPAV